MLQKTLLLGLSIYLAPALAGPLFSRAGPSEFELGDPYYLCLRDDGSIDRGATATCDRGSSAAKLNDIREGSTGDVEFFYVDETNPRRNHVLHLDCAGGHSSPVTITETAPPTTVTEIETDTIIESRSVTITRFETDTITEIPPPATVTATVTEACYDNGYGDNGYNNGYDNDGYNNNGYDNNGYNNGYNNNGYDNNGYNNGYDNNGYNNGYNNNGYNNNGYNNNGYGGNSYY
ncbi:hypothetical protein P168DRAFT_290903 [Aspergillus campestris IBT 28561]|uniref:Cyanovirin-N domain-containing protein n=1 Tax=Aspergillus campestris (strain IBT 28561) TaxID=1392248 RepID=A0A2I1D1M3_ASPC2|nr:uncharacterized protein P168DRAFT_290903 [Aspergillus campestris IBT 28561]PKY03775.1 hypothetical protein P168DRAFT_290903 [Aspergillus campestris IBT 28561]